jgi:hypothetical protein
MHRQLRRNAAEQAAAAVVASLPANRLHAALA